jgi:VanZ family protein
VAVMHGPVDAEISRSSRISPSIRTTLTQAVSGAVLSAAYHGRVSRLFSWLPPLLWMAVILIWLSSDAFSAAHTGGRLETLLRWLLPAITAEHIEGVHLLVRKGAHFTVYGLLAALWLRAFVRERVLPLSAAAWLAFAITVAWACVDEMHQSTTVSREGSPIDVAIDATGAAVVLLVARMRWSGVVQAREEPAKR